MGMYIKRKSQEISKAINSLASFPKKQVVHRHLKNIDFPRTPCGHPDAFIHPDLQGRDWQPIKDGHPLFQNLKGEVFRLSDKSVKDQVVPVFINEAAYAEKNIAMSLTKREIWNFEQSWRKAFYQLVAPYI